jgi:predicted component of viral defense system (DUF524 family)
MVLPHTSKIAFLTKQHEELEQPKEWSPVIIVVNGEIENWDRYSLLLNNREFPLSLKVIKGEKKIVTDPIRLGTGNYKVKLRLENEIHYEVFSVFPYKISNDAYHIMLEELAFQLPADISVSLSELGAFSGEEVTRRQKVTIAQELLRLKRTINGTDKKPGLLKMIEMVAKKPHHFLMSHDVVVRRENARRINPARLAQAIHKQGNLDTRGLPLKVIDTRVEHSYNTYENQLIKLFSHQVQMRLRKLIRLFQALNRGELIEEGVSLQRNFQSSLRKAKFLENVDLPDNFILKTTMVLLNVPAYKAIFEGFIDFQKVISSNINDPDLESPLENTPSLYQKWGTLKVLANLLALGVENGYVVKKQSLFKSMIGDSIIGLIPDGRPAAILVHPTNGTTIKFIPERSYVRKGNPLTSISFTQRPDISIEVTRPNGETKVYVFDPKYKLDSEEQNTDDQSVVGGKPKKVDVDKMHAYRDAIRDKEGNRVVMFAATLYPGETYTYGEGLSAIQTYPSKTTEFDETISHVLKEILGVAEK